MTMKHGGKGKELVTITKHYPSSRCLRVFRAFSSTLIAEILVTTADDNT
jgi:hypothetical protein